MRAEKIDEEMKKESIAQNGKSKIEMNLKCDERCSETNFHTEATHIILISFVVGAATV